MNRAFNQLILAGFLCQGLSWDGPGLLMFNGLLWTACVLWRKCTQRALRLPSWAEAILLVLGALAGYAVSNALGQSAHFAIGHGVTALQAVRLLRQLEPREKNFSVILALLQMGVACTIILDARFLFILGALIWLLPRTLLELQCEKFRDGSPTGATQLPLPVKGRSTDRPKLARTRFLFHVAPAGMACAFFLLFPRAYLGTSFVPQMAGLIGQGTLADSVLDPARSGLEQSSRVLLQIEGRAVGYLRVFTLVDFDGKQWHPERRTALRRIGPTTNQTASRLVYRRVRVKQPSFLGRILPVDGDVTHVDGNFFRRPMKNSNGAVECESTWTAVQNTYEYWIDPRPRPERLTARQRDRLTESPAPSAQVKAWLDLILQGNTNAFDQARLLEGHFHKFFRYELGAPQLDRIAPLEDFLFHKKEGHCERFASSLALLLRMNGIPSRVVVGYLPRARNLLGEGYAVRLKDAHAWTEAYFKDKGWVQFDATPPARLGAGESRLREFWEALDFAWSMHVLSFDSASQSTMLRDVGQAAERSAVWLKKRLPWLLGLALIVAVISSARRWKPRARNGIEPKRDSVALAEHFYGRLLKVLSRHGWQRAPQQTPLEFFQELSSAALPELKTIFFVTERFCTAAYGGAEIGEADRNELERLVSGLERTFHELGPKRLMKN